MVRIVVALAILASLAGAQEKAPEPSRVVKGFGLSPQGFPSDFSKLGEFFAETGAMKRGGVMWAGRWFEPAKAGLIPAGATSVARNAEKYGYTPIFVFGWRAGTKAVIAVPGSEANAWSDSRAGSLFQKTLAEFAALYKPPFLFLGNENDFYYEQNPDDYANWIRVYNATYDAVKTVSPDTAVGPIFSFEHLAGAGKLNGWTTPHWKALTLHDMKRVNLVGVSVYPWLGVATAAALASDYFDPLVERAGSVPIAITETGWPAEKPGGLAVAWEASPEAQVVYLSRLSASLRGKDVRIVNWLHLYPVASTADTPAIWKLFASVTLRDSAGKKRPAYDRWLEFLP